LRISLLSAGWLLLTASFTATPGSRAAAQELIPVDLELVLAIDTSASVDRREFDLQMEGVVRAFRDPAVIAAIRTTGPTGIAVTVVHWSSAHQQRRVVPWTQIRNGLQARAFADAIAAAQQRLYTGSTGVGSALTFGERTIRTNRFDGRRKTIDVSGDGVNNSGALPELVRDRVVDAGVTVNGLAILNESPFLDRYYERLVIGGPGSFVMSVAKYDQVIEALRKKLIREIASATAMNEPVMPGNPVP
jgi:hypothetical protein